MVAALVEASVVEAVQLAAPEAQLEEEVALEAVSEVDLQAPSEATAVVWVVLVDPEAVTVAATAALEATSLAATVVLGGSNSSSDKSNCHQPRCDRSNKTSYL
uniref:Uncharacterized protein n=1 Tax=Rhipicephalus appendiculatus TaxID=34631 RepID=A0A131YGN6_RHIAP